VPEKWRLFRHMLQVVDLESIYPVIHMSDASDASEIRVR
jgi:hypothetical protein